MLHPIGQTNTNRPPSRGIYSTLFPTFLPNPFIYLTITQLRNKNKLLKNYEKLIRWIIVT